jgi:glutamate--cysteine ligase
MVIGSSLLDHSKEKQMSEIIKYLDNFITQNSEAIDKWFDKNLENFVPAIYCSVDIRNSGRKLAHVDTNLFPAGFNNISTKAVKLAAEYLSNYLNKYFNQAKKILIIPESHSRNRFYIDNIEIIKTILSLTGRFIEIAFLEQIEEPILNSKNEEVLISHVVVLDNNDISTKEGFTPDLILLNNDLTKGVPEILLQASQPIIPLLSYGWYTRRKSTHFERYNEILDNFCKQFGLDSFLISTATHKCNTVNFKEKTGIDCMALNVEKMIHHLKVKYKEYGIADEPYVFIKADQGTYGMGIITANSGEELYQLNKKNINKMNIIKNGIVNSNVIIQEGIKTVDTIDNFTAEPMIYMAANQPIDLFYRVNKIKNAYANLNSTGMEFQHYDNHDSFNHPVFRACGLIAKLACLASSHE